jgi:two-component system phosphate regulon sensor histidine kinase PhoR
VRSRIFVKLMLAFLVVIVAAVATVELVVQPAWKRSLQQEIEKALTRSTLLFAERVQNVDPATLPEVVESEARAADARATVIDSTGRVLADSEGDPDKMENHATRPEFQAALAGRIGTDTRRSASVAIPYLYVAAPARGGAVRMAYPLASVDATMREVSRRMLLGGVVALLVAIVVAAVASQLIARRLQQIVRFAERIAGGDLGARISTSSRDEIAQVASALDVTARQLEQSFAEVERSRSELEALLNSMEDAVIAVSVHRTVMWANQRMNELASGGVRVGVDIVETIRDPEVLRALDEAATHRAVSTAETSSLLPRRTFHVTAAPMPDKATVLVLHDITDVERVERTRRDFIANVSHELRTPLTSIEGYSETLMDSLPPEEAVAREFVDIIRKNAQRMTRITEGLLTLAKVESGERTFQFAPQAPGVLLEEARATFAERARVQNIVIDVEEVAIGSSVRADADAIHQVLSNLIDNAMKHAPSGSRIVLGARDHQAGVEFYVQDSGPGIASEHLPRIFERFYRVDKARSRDSGGTGLGLAIAKHIVLAHGGQLRAESQLNRGSTFIFWLPAAA